jgi:flavin reductase (DIM6/NTAB) family NADH-FMN oxidoreductase RutF
MNDLSGSESSREGSQADPEHMKRALRQLASGVSVATTRHGDELFGITVTSFTSISLEPPVILIAINNDSPMAAAVIGSKCFAVHVLSADQHSVASTFATSVPGRQKFAGIDYEFGPTGAPGLPGSLATLDCTVDQHITVGTHSVIFGRVVHARAHEPEASPLIYYHRNYRHLSRKIDSPAHDVADSREGSSKSEQG